MDAGFSVAAKAADVDQSAQFRRIEQQRAHEYVADQLQRQISLRLVQPGRPLPPERALAQMFGVGRATVQRAIKLLQDEGLVDSKRGRNGGNFVVDLGPTAGSERLLDELRQDRPVIEQALAFRLEIEPAAAALAADGGDAAIAAIIDASARLGPELSDPVFDGYDIEFHLAVVRATANEFFVDAVERTRMQIGGALRGMPESELWHERTIREHAAIVEAIEAKDSRKAKARMRAHVLHTDRSVRALLSAL
jgi:GntR family transcriptional regulator, transcriptional repressor for pyruvate dehydrogenase complex